MSGAPLTPQQTFDVLGFTVVRDEDDAGRWVAYLRHEDQQYIRFVYITRPQNGRLGLAEQIR